MDKCTGKIDLSEVDAVKNSIGSELKAENERLKKELEERRKRGREEEEEEQEGENSEKKRKVSEKKEKLSEVQFANIKKALMEEKLVLNSPVYDNGYGNLKEYFNLKNNAALKAQVENGIELELNENEAKEMSAQIACIKHALNGAKIKEGADPKNKDYYDTQMYKLFSEFPNIIRLKAITSYSGRNGISKAANSLYDYLKGQNHGIPQNKIDLLR